MSVVPVDWNVARTAVERAATDIADLVRAAPEPDAIVPGLTWSVRELSSHIADEARRYAEFAQGITSSFPEDMSAFNEKRIRDLETNDQTKLADIIERETQAFLDSFADSAAPTKVFDVPADAGSAAGILLGEYRIHAIDLAKALGRRASLAHGDALLITYGVLVLIPLYVDAEATRGLHATYELKLRGGETISMTFDEAKLTIEHGRAQRPDCRISADPVAFLLVGYGRQSQWRAILSGKLFASGRKPWLGLRFTSLLRNP